MTRSTYEVRFTYYTYRGEMKLAATRVPDCESAEEATEAWRRSTRSEDFLHYETVKVD